jgi:hypothetical protein
MKYRYSLGHNAGILYRAGGLSTSNPNPKDKHMNEDAIVKAVISALEQTEVWRWAKQQIAEAEAGDGFDGMDDGSEEFGGSYTDEFPEDQYDDDQYVEDEPLGDDEAAFADDGEEPVRFRYARPRDNRDDDPCWADDCDPQYAAAARGRPAYKPRMLGSLSKFPRRGDRADATWFSGDGDSPSTSVKTIEMPPWTRSSASPFVERREDGSFSMSEAVRHATADPKQIAAVRKAADEMYRRWSARRLEGVA